MAHILIIEDNADHRALFARMIQHAGHRVVAVATASAGMEYVRQQIPDLIMLDLRLPDSDGWRVANTLKSDLHTKSIPVLIITAEPLARERIAAQAFNYDAILLKPFNIDVFMSTITRLLASRPSHRDTQALGMGFQRSIGTPPAPTTDLPSD